MTLPLCPIWAPPKASVLQSVLRELSMTDCGVCVLEEEEPALDLWAQCPAMHEGPVSGTGPESLGRFWLHHTRWVTSSGGLLFIRAPVSFACLTFGLCQHSI